MNGLLEEAALPIALTGTFIASTYSSVLSFVSVHVKNIGLEEASSYMVTEPIHKKFGKHKWAAEHR